ncbi:hypothetical protein Tco_1408660 [Tanacetum coccineum]
MDWLSKRKFVIVCHEKVVRIPLEGDEILQVHGERTQGVVKTLMNTKFRIDLVHGATPVAKSPYRLAPLEMQELSEQLRELQDKDVKDKILATPIETSKVENAPAKMLRDLDQQMEKRADDGVKDAMSKTLAAATAEIIELPESVRTRLFEYCLGILKRMDKSLVLWAEIRESSLIGPELVQETTDKVVLIKRAQGARDRQKSYADNRLKPLEFEVGDRVMLKVSP